MRFLVCIFLIKNINNVPMPLPRTEITQLNNKITDRTRKRRNTEGKLVL